MNQDSAASVVIYHANLPSSTLQGAKSQPGAWDFNDQDDPLGVWETELLASFSTPLPEENDPAPALETPAEPQPEDGLSRSVHEAQFRLEQFINNLQKQRAMLTQDMIIETSVGGRTVARSQITRSGDLKTYLSAPLDPTLLEVHHQTVKKVRSQRVALLNVVTKIDRSLAGISDGMEMGTILSVQILPIVYRFVKTILEDGQSAGVKP